MDIGSPFLLNISAPKETFDQDSFPFNDNLQEIHYEDTEHYTLTKDFLNKPEKYFRHLFS